ncbi:MAG: hypothetical protein HYX86_03575, partial [Chloroflexi bacterium]|nr:hypothetical protein [Chloroflexota bacterium]
SDFRKASAGLVGLHDISWVWKELTEERIKEHLQKGEVLAYLGPGGAIDALAIVAGLAGGEERWISYLDGKPSAVQELALALRGWGDPLREIEGLFPEPSVVVSILEEVGYQRGYEPRMWIFEKRFGPEEG